MSLTRRQLFGGALLAAATVTSTPPALAVASSGVDPFEGVPLWSYGHSYTMYPAAYASQYGGEYQERIARRLGTGKVRSMGQSGAVAAEMTGAALGTTYNGTTRTYPASRRGGIVLWQCSMNDITSESYQGDAAYLRGFKHSVRAFLATVSAGDRVETADGWFDANWRTYTGATRAMYSDGDVRYTSTYGALAGYPVTGDTCYVVALATDNANPSGTMAFYVDGVKVGAWSGQDQMASYDGQIVDSSHCAAVIKITGMNAAAGTTGAKTLTAKVTSSGENVYLNCVLIPAPNPPKVFLGIEPPRKADSSVKSGRFQAYHSTFDAAVASVAGEFPNAEVVDLDPGWDNATMVGTMDPANYHPNDIGMSCIADNFVEAIKATVTVPAAGVLTL